MRNLMRNVSHKFRCAPLSTVNFARKLPNPLGTTGGTVSSGMTVALIASPTAPRSKLQHVREKLSRVEPRKVVDVFASADETRRNSEFVLNCNYDPAFAAAIEFGDDEASKRQRTMEFAGLGQRVAAGRGVDHEQCLVRRVGIEFGERPFHFLELRHEIGFSVLAARRIAKQKVDLALRRSLVRFIAKRDRISTVLAANHFNAESFSPNSKLLDRRGTKRVGCRQHHLRWAIEVNCPYLQMMREFCCRCCFASS